jgi:high affinity cGMP-specific 3',5'-cyclic phosphodiesterase 9
MYNVICLAKLATYFDPTEILALMVGALSHDLDHTGFGNSFQVNASTNLALLYNDFSPLEMHHCAVAFHILNKPDCNILASFDKVNYRRFRNYIIE